MSQQQQTYAPVVRTVTVAAPRERAFTVFTEQLGTWWPKEYSIGASDMADFVMEPKVGGRWYEVGVDGAECDTGTVTVYDPPARLVFIWQLDGSFRYDPDPAHGSEVEVRFVAEGPGTTRVELEHRHFERHGATAAALAEAVGGDGGWNGLLASYAEALGSS